MSAVEWGAKEKSQSHLFSHLGHFKCPTWLLEARQDDANFYSLASRYHVLTKVTHSAKLTSRLVKRYSALIFNDDA